MFDKSWSKQDFANIQVPRKWNGQNFMAVLVFSGEHSEL